MQKLTIAEKYFARVASGKKTSSIWKGLRAVVAGPTLLVTPDESAQMVVFVTGAEVVQYKDLAVAHAKAYGFKTKAELEKELSTIYSGLKPSDDMTVISFTANQNKFASTRRPAQKTPNRKVSRHTEEGIEEDVLE